MSFRKRFYENKKKIFLYGSGTFVMFFAFLVALSNLGVGVTTSGDIICGDTCVSYFNITLENNSLCFGTTFQGIYFDKNITYELYKADARYKADNPARWKPYNFAVGSCLAAGRTHEFKLVGHKSPTQTVKWGMSYGVSGADPLWKGLTPTNIIGQIEDADSIEVVSQTGIDKFLTWTFTKINETTWHAEFEFDRSLWSDARNCIAAKTNVTCWASLKKDYFPEMTASNLTTNFLNLTNYPLKAITKNIRFSDFNIDTDKGFGSFDIVFPEKFSTDEQANLGFGTTTIQTGTNTGCYPNERCICRDDSNNIHVVYRYSTSAIYYAKSTDNGLTWTVNTSFYGNSSTAGSTKFEPAISCNGNNITVAYEDSGSDDVIVGISTDSGATWAWKGPVTSAVNQFVVVERARNNIYVAYDNGSSYPGYILVVKSTDGGSTWGAPVIGGYESGNDVRYPSLSVNSSGVNDILHLTWVGSSSIRYANSSDNGSTWTAYVDIITFDSTYSGPVMQWDDSGSVFYWEWVSGSQYVKAYGSSNGGSSWTGINLNTTSQSSEISGTAISSTNGIAIWASSIPSNYIMKYREHTRSVASGSELTLNDESAQNRYINVKKGINGNRIEFFWRKGSSSPYNIMYSYITLDGVPNIIAMPSIIPQTITKSLSNLNCSAVYNGASNGRVEFIWYLNGAIQNSYNGSTGNNLANLTLAYTNTTLPNSTYYAWNNITCAARAWNGTAYSAWVNSTAITVTNENPWWSENSTNSTGAGTAIKHSVKSNDPDSGLSSYIFAISNGTVDNDTIDFNDPITSFNFVDGRPYHESRYGGADASLPLGYDSPSAAGESYATAAQYTGMQALDGLDYQSGSGGALNQYHYIKIRFKTDYNSSEVTVFNWSLKGRIAGTGQGPTFLYIWNWTAGSWFNTTLQLSGTDTMYSYQTSDSNAINDFVNNSNGYVDVATIMYKGGSNPGIMYINYTFLKLQAPLYYYDGLAAFSGYSNYSNVTKTAPSAGTTVRWKVFMNDTYNFWNATDDFRYVTTSTADTTPPTYSEAGTNTTIAGNSVLFSIKYNDETALQSNGTYIFSTNNTGSWVNESAVNWTATPQYANISKVLNSTVGVMVGYRWYAKDNAGNWNNSVVYTLTTSDASPPTYSRDQDNSSSYGTTVPVGAAVLASVYWTDVQSNLHTGVFYTNQSGSLIINGTCSFASKTEYCNKTITIYSTDTSKTICWKQYANDTSGNLNSSMTTKCFNVEAAYINYGINYTNRTDGSWTLFGLPWATNGQLAGSIFGWNNGSNWTQSQMSSDLESGTQTFVAASGGSMGQENAVYNSTLGAPDCQYGSPCNATSTLLKCTDAQTGGPEPNAPNTIGSEVDSTTSGTCHADESVESVMVTSLNHTGYIGQGDTIEINITFYCYSTYTGDYYAICYTSNSGSPSWSSVVGSTQCGAAAYWNKKINYTLGTGLTKPAIRTQMHYGAVSSCTMADTSYYDIDDLAFVVSSGSGDVEANKTAVNYADVLSPATYEQIDRINVTVNISYFNTSGSVAAGNNNATLWLHIWNGSDWLDSGNFTVTGAGNTTRTITTASVLTAWKTAGNRDINISARYMDYNSGGAFDTINWTDVWVTADSQQEFLNDSYAAFTGTANWSNVTKFVNTTVGSIIKYKWFANTTGGLANQTSTFTFTVTTSGAPNLNISFGPPSTTVWRFIGCGPAKSNNSATPENQTATYGIDYLCNNGTLSGNLGIQYSGSLRTGWNNVWASNTSISANLINLTTSVQTIYTGLGANACTYVWFKANCTNVTANSGVFINYTIA